MASEASAAPPHCCHARAPRRRSRTRLLTIAAVACAGEVAAEVAMQMERLEQQHVEQSGAFGARAREAPAKLGQRDAELSNTRRLHLLTLDTVAAAQAAEVVIAAALTAALAAAALAALAAAALTAAALAAAQSSAVLANSNTLGTANFAVAQAADMHAMVNSLLT